MEPWGIESMARRERGAFRDNACRGAPSARSIASMDRFWFHGGRLAYKTNGTAVVLETVEIRLSTEAQTVSGNGTVTGQSRPSPGADQFVRAFQEHLTEAGTVLPIYRELTTLYRAAGLAVATYEAMGESATRRLSWLLDRQPLRPQSFLSAVPGLGRFTLVSIQEGQTIHSVTGATCGGVEFWFDKANRTSLPDDGGTVATTARGAVAGRPQPNRSLSWRRTLWRC